MVHPASDVADFFILSLGDVSHLKLQKLCYYAEGYSLALLGRQLFSDEIQAWQHGPVVRSVYLRFRGSGAKALAVPGPRAFAFDSMQRAALARVLSDKGNMTGWQLRNETHRERPWRLCYGRANSAIPRSVIGEWFRGRVALAPT